MPIRITYNNEEEKYEKLKKLQQQYQDRLNETLNTTNTASENMNINNNDNNLWDQIKTTANNNFNNTNSLTFGFDDTIQGNKQASNFLKGLAKNSGYGRNNGFKTSSRASDYMKQALEANKRSQDLQAQEEAKEKDKDSSILSKVGDFFKNLLSGVTQGSANLAQGYTDTMAMLEKNLSKNKTSRLDNQIEVSPYINDELNYENKVNANRENTVDKLIGNVGNTIGNMIPSIVVGQATGNAFSDVGGKIGTAISKNASNMAMATQVLGNETANTQLDGQDFNKSYVTGLAKSAVSFATEKLTGGDILSKGTSLDDMAKKYVVNKFKSDWGKRLATAGLNIAGEVTEENLENQLNYVVDKVINNKDMPDLKNWWNDASETTKTTFFTTALMQLVGLGGSSYKDYVDTDNMNKNDTKNYQKAFDEVKKVINNTSNTKDATTNNVNTNLNTSTNTQQDIANRLNEIVQNDKYLSQEDKESMIYATNNLASKNQLDSKNTLDAINQIKQMSQLSQEQNDQLDTGKKYLSGRKEIYNKYRNVTNYDNSIVQQAKDTVAPNKQGKRTKEQWLDVAKYIGTNIADRPNSEIQKIAYKSWQDETPNNSATLNKQGQKYVKFMSDDWIDTIYDAVEKQRQKSGYVANNDTVNALDNFYNEYNNQTIQNNNIQNNIDTSSMNLIDSAKAYNLNGNDETIQSINQKLNDRGISSRFDENLFKDSNGKVRTDINALWKNTIDEKGNTQREVIFNPKADTNKTLQQVSIHEMLHDMTGTKEFEDLSKLILDKNSNREGYSNARSNLEEMYSQVYDRNSKEFKSLVDEEEVADTLAQKLGDQDFINSLNKEKPNVFKRIYSWIVDKLNKFTGNKNEKLYWEDVKNKFESAYRQDYQGTSNSNRFSIQTDSNGNKFVKIDTNQDIFKGKTLSEQTKIAKQYILDNFRDKGLKIDDENINVTSKTANEYTHPKNQLPYKTKQAKIKASTELDNMLNISDYQYSSNDDGRHRFAKDGWDYYKTVFEVDGVKFEGLVNIAKSENKKTFYDVTNIKRISQNRSASDKSFSTSLTNSNNSIPTSNNNVNTISNNSMQESENNSGSLNLSQKQEINKIKQDGSITMTYVRNANTNTQNYGSRYGQNIEPSGEYMSMDTMQGKYKIPGFEYGTIDFKKPLILEHKDTTANGWKKDLSERYRGLTGKKLSEAIKKDGYDAIMTKDEDGNFIEIVNLNGKKTGNSNTRPSIEQSGAWQSFLENQIGSTGKGKTIQELRLPTKENWDIVKNNNKNSKDLPDTKQFIVEKRTKKKLPIKEIKDELAQKIINKGHYIDKLAKKTGDKNLTYLYDRTLNSFNEAQISIGDNQVNSKGEVVGKSLNDIFKQAEEMKLNVDFEDYLLNKHNIARTAFGKSIYGDTVSAPQSKRITENYEKQHPEFKEWAKEVNKYNDNNLKDLVDNGLVSKETYDKLKEMYGDYVPTYRDITETMQEFEDNRVGNNTLKSATKSNKNILSVKESMAEQTLAIKKAIRINNIGKELYKILGKDSKIMDGIEVDPTLMYTLDGEVVEKAKDGQNTFAIFDDGEITYFKISDDIYSAFSKDTLQNKINNSEVAKALLTPVEKLSQVQRNLLTTYSIGFAFNNPIKDFQDAVFNSKYSTGQFLKNYSKALYNIAKNGDWYKSYKNNGGTANTYFDYNKGLLPTKTKNPIKKFVNKIKDVNEILEQAPRLSEYISTIENNGSIDEALYNAAEITTNFKRGGDIAKVANKYGANFLNASIQGLDKFYRNLSGRNGWKGYASLLTKATLFQVVPSIVNGLLLKDDDDYSDLPEYTKDNYFLFKIGDGKFFRIPKGRVSSLIGGLSRRVLETAEGKEVDWKSLVDTTVNQMAPNNPFSDNVLAPIKQAIENKAWYGGEIVSSRLQKLPTAEQYDEKTDNLSKTIGKYTGMSPKKINYVLDQYSGGIGDVLLPMMTPQAENNILEDKFTTDAVLKNKNVSKYYEEVDNLEKNKNSENATDNDILKYKYLTEVSKDLSDLYSEKRNIENSNLSDKEKKIKVRKVQKEINNIVEERLDNVETINSNSKVAKIGDSQYYKYHGEWTKLSDDEKEKNKKISLKSYADFKNKVYNETEKKRKSGDLKENQQLKNTSKSEILLKSNYSNKEKLALYKNYVSSTDKKVEVAVEKLNMPIDVYLNYKTNQFENDKDKDGETISGTKKQKVYNYVNSLDNVDLIYKYMIVKMEGINDSDGDKAIINYVNKSQKFNFEERKEALKTLGFKVDKYGNVENMIFIPIKSKIK